MSNADSDKDHDDHGAGHGHHGSPFIQHHYDDAQHQFDSGKLGIWFFLAQEILFFSGLFVAYVLYRHHHPEIYSYASHYLDVKWGAINTAVLIVSSLSAAWAVRCAQLNQRRGLIACLLITIVCALGFLGIKTIEYKHKYEEDILWGRKFDPCVASAGNHLLNKKNRCPGVKSSVVWNFGTGAADRGCLVGDYDQDADAPGLQGHCQVAEVKKSTKWVSETVDGKPVRKFVVEETGRRSIAPCVEDAGHGGGGHGGGGHAAAKPCWELVENHHVCKVGPAALVLYGDHAVRPTTPSNFAGAGIEIEVTCDAAPVVPAPVDAFADPDQPIVEGRITFRKSPKLSKHDAQHLFASGPPPEHTNMFFSIYFAMTGLHGIHVLVGVFIFIWLLIRAIKGHFTPEYFGPVDYAALYWHLVDLIWIFLFPLLYLIH